MPYAPEATYDHIYALGQPQGAEEYCEYAAVVQHMQYKALVEGFLARMWEYYTAMVMWKSQSPWSAPGTLLSPRPSFFCAQYTRPRSCGQCTRPEQPPNRRRLPLQPPSAIART